MNRVELIHDIAKVMRPSLFVPGTKPGEQRELLRRVEQVLQAAFQCGMKHPDLVMDDAQLVVNRPISIEKLKELREIEANKIRPAFHKKRELMGLTLQQCAELVGIAKTTMVRFSRETGRADEASLEKIRVWVGYEKE